MNLLYLGLAESQGVCCHLEKGKESPRKGKGKESPKEGKEEKEGGKERGMKNFRNFLGGDIDTHARGQDKKKPYPRQEVGLRFGWVQVRFRPRP
jgi:hypothetical protein